MLWKREWTCIEKKLSWRSETRKNLDCSTISEFVGKREQTAAVKVTRKVGKDEWMNWEKNFWRKTSQFLL
jgi:hypothetical protein